MRHDLSDEFDERRWKITLQAFQENLAIGILIFFSFCSNGPFNDYSLFNMYIKIGKQNTLYSIYKSLFTYFRHEDD